MTPLITKSKRQTYNVQKSLAGINGCQQINHMILKNQSVNQSNH